MSNNKKESNPHIIPQKKTGQELLKIPDTIISNFEEISNSNNQILQQGTDINILSDYYNKKSGNSGFLEKINRLNKKFYNASDKYVKSKKNVEKLNDDLYMNLFQQINCYVEEIERLNKKISTNNNQELKKTIEQLNKEINEKKEKIRNYEIKLREKTTNEEKLTKEIESYKRRIIFYKDKIKIGLLTRNKNNEIRGSNSRENLRKTNINLHTNNLSHSPNSKNKLNKDDISNLTLEEDNNKRNLLYDNKKNYTDENIKINKKIKIKESIYKNDLKNNYLVNRTEYDIDGKDFEEKENENNDNYTIKVNPINKVSSEEHSKNLSSGFLHSRSKEFYTPEKDTNENYVSNKNIDNFIKNTSSEIVTEKKDNKEVEKEEKSKTIFRRSAKGHSLTNKIKKHNLYSNNNKNKGTKSKIFNLSKNNKTSNYISIRNNKDKSNLKLENNNKENQVKVGTKSNQKNPNKNNVSNIIDVQTSNDKKKYQGLFDKDKEKGIHKNNKSQSSTGSLSKIKFNTNTIQTKGIDVIQNNNKAKKDSNMNRNKTKNLMVSNSSLSNMKVVSSKAMNNKKVNEKDNNKNLINVLKDMNDDYIKSIEMLRSQEDQIKYLLSFIDVDEK